MNSDAIDKRLSQISTVWSLIDRTRGKDDTTTAVALLVERYQAAAYRYLLAATRDPDAADELFQEFALRLVRGDFGKADPSRGRFRDYVKSALINLVNTHQTKRKKHAHGPLTADPAAPETERFDSDAEFLMDWRQALLDLAWQALAAEQGPTGPPYHAALRLRNDNPTAPVTQLAEQLTAELKPPQPYTDAGVRKILQRARERFTDLLVAEVARSLREPTDEALTEELFDLGFHAYCQGALDRWRERRGR